MVLKGVKWAHDHKIRSNGIERSQLGTQDHKNHGLGSKNEVLKIQFSFKLKTYTDSLKTTVFGPKTIIFDENHAF